jgi:hypothetical protein
VPVTINHNLTPQLVNHVLDELRKSDINRVRNYAITRGVPLSTLDLSFHNLPRDTFDSLPGKVVSWPVGSAGTIDYPYWSKEVCMPGLRVLFYCNEPPTD